MTTKDKLEKLIKKAIEDGWEVPTGARMTGYDAVSEYIDFTSEHQKEYSEHVYAVIFNHSFANALFGEKQPIPYEKFFEDTMPSARGNQYSNMIASKIPSQYDKYISQFDPDWFWKDNLQQAVISEDSINYMYQVIFRDEQ